MPEKGILPDVAEINLPMNWLNETHLMSDPPSLSEDLVKSSISFPSVKY